ncbi:MAG: amidase, partial [Gammaproteobacteria bacterium]|nr:amidase [Gammaproteobacteria bacterium]
AFAAEVGAPTGRLRLALVTDTPDHGTPLDPEAKQAVEDAARLLEELGHHVEPRPVPYDFWPLYKTYTALVAAQTAAFFEAMAPVVGRPAGPDDMAHLYWTMSEKGRSFSAIDHSNQIEQMRAACVAMAGTMDAFDAWLMPTLPMLPREHGYYDMTLDVETYDDTRMGPDCCYTAPFNASGAPAISLPLGWSRTGLPIGVQLVGRAADEAALIRLAAQLEQARPWAGRQPPIAG